MTVCTKNAQRSNSLNQTRIYTISILKKYMHFIHDYFSLINEFFNGKGRKAHGQ